jgi:hypothetical protein
MGEDEALRGCSDAGTFGRGCLLVAQIGVLMVLFTNESASACHL